MTAGCKVRTFSQLPHGRQGPVIPTCGKPVVARGLCTKHFADRIRLGGK